MNKKKRPCVLLVGGYPPPYGGISVHIQRLHQYIIDNGWKCKILHTGFDKSNLINNNDIIWIFDVINLFKLKRTNPIVHIHVSAFRNLLKIYILSYFFKNQRKLITIHSGAFTKKLNKQSKLKHMFLRKVLGNFNYIITVNTEQKQLLSSVLRINSNKIVVIPAFIYPTASKNDIDSTNISLVEQSNKIKIVMSGYLQDYYGYDLIIDNLENHPKYFGFFVFYGTPDKEYKSMIVKRINNMDNAHFFADLSPQQFNWLLKNTDIYVRNTDRDGDCVAIREAAYWGVKVCASSSATRPVGTELFSFNNKIELENAIRNVINQPNLGKIAPGINYANNIYEVYKSLTQ